MFFRVRIIDSPRTVPVGGNIHRTNCGGLPGHLPNKIRSRRCSTFQPAAPFKDQPDDHASRSTRPWRRLHPTDRALTVQRSTSVGDPPLLAHRRPGPTRFTPQRRSLPGGPDRLASRHASSPRPHSASRDRDRSRHRQNPTTTTPTPPNRHLESNRAEILRVIPRSARRHPVETSGDSRTDHRHGSGRDQHGSPPTMPGPDHHGRLIIGHRTPARIVRRGVAPLHADDSGLAAHGRRHSKPAGPTSRHRHPGTQATGDRPYDPTTNSELTQRLAPRISSPTSDSGNSA